MHAPGATTTRHSCPDFTMCHRTESSTALDAEGAAVAVVLVVAGAAVVLDSADATPPLGPLGAAAGPAQARRRSNGAARRSFIALV